MISTHRGHFLIGALKSLRIWWYPIQQSLLKSRTNKHTNWIILYVAVTVYVAITCDLYHILSNMRCTRDSLDIDDMPLKHCPSCMKWIWYCMNNLLTYAASAICAQGKSNWTEAVVGSNSVVTLPSATRVHWTFINICMMWHGGHN